MTHCNWCGLVSEDDAICSWCKRPFKDGDPPEGSQNPSPKPGRTRNIAAAVVGLCLILLVAFLGLRMRPLSVKNAAPKPAVMAADNHSGLAGVPIPPQGYGVHHESAPATLAPGMTVEPLAPGDDQSPTSPDDQGATPVAGDAQPLGSVQVLSASLTARDDDSGQEWAAGAVTIKNTGPYPVTDFLIVLRVNDIEYSLTPFNGSISDPQAVTNRRIEPGAQIVVPVMTATSYPAAAVVLARSVIVRADIDGPPGTVSDSIQAVLGQQ